MSILHSDACVEAVAKALSYDYPVTFSGFTEKMMLDLAEHAIEALLGQLQMSESEAYQKYQAAVEVLKGTQYPYHFGDGYVQALRDLGLVRDNE